MMPVRLLLQWLLCLGLILNGSGHAMAGGKLPGGPQPTTGHAMAMHGCQDAAAAAQAPEQVQSAHAGQSANPDCCQGADNCDCDCQQHSAANLPRFLLLAARPADTRVLHGADAGRTAPVPQRLIRPPISA